MKRRIKQGAKVIVIDPRVIDLVESPHVKAEHHLQLKPGTNVAVITALAHVIVTEKLYNDEYVKERCEDQSFQDWKNFVSLDENSPEATQKITGVDPLIIREAARLYAKGPNSAIYYGLV